MSRMSDAAIQKLDAARIRYEELGRELSDPATFSDNRRAAELGREQSDLSNAVLAFDRYRALESQAEEAQEMLKDSTDQEMQEMAKEELASLEASLDEVVAVLREHLRPRDPNDDRDVIVEIRGAEGGDEANLWAGDLMRMYMRYAELRNWKYEVINASETELGGVKEVTFEIHGRDQGAYSRLKWEGGTHRVQRVPATEAQGRIHTSTATVNILPKADEVDVQIRDEDVRVDVYRAGGHGGQGVNTTDSAVRLTHIPTGLVVTCQDERSQIKNKAAAMAVLRSRLFEMEIRRHAEELGTLRKLQVGTGERAEKIRTYNYRENRVTDHRINLTVYNLDRVLQGQIDPLLDALADASRAEDEGEAEAA